LAIAQGTLPWQTTKVGKSAFLIEKNSLSRCQSETDKNIIRIAMCSVEAQMKTWA